MINALHIRTVEDQSEYILLSDAALLWAMAAAKKRQKERVIDGALTTPLAGNRRRGKAMQINQKILAVIPCFAIALITINQINPAHAAADSDNIRFDLGILSGSQVEYLYKEILAYAMSETNLEYCGIDTNIEQRVTFAVSDCLSTRSITAVINAFHEYKEATRQQANRETMGGSELFDCSPVNIQKLKEEVDALVVQLERMCKSCNACRD